MQRILGNFSPSNRWTSLTLIYFSAWLAYPNATPVSGSTNRSPVCPLHRTRLLWSCPRYPPCYCKLYDGTKKSTHVDRLLHQNLLKIRLRTSWLFVVLVLHSACGTECIETYNFGKSEAGNTPPSPCCGCHPEEDPGSVAWRGDRGEDRKGARQAAMKGYRTPSWFRMKGLRKKTQVKAQMNEPRTRKPKKAERGWCKKDQLLRQFLLGVLGEDRYEIIPVTHQIH